MGGEGGGGGLAARVKDWVYDNGVLDFILLGGNGTGHGPHPLNTH